jgi:hypothetical protein
MARAPEEKIAMQPITFENPLKISARKSSGNKIADAG